MLSWYTMVGTWIVLAVAVAAAWFVSPQLPFSLGTGSRDDGIAAAAAVAAAEQSRWVAMLQPELMPWLQWVNGTDPVQTTQWSAAKRQKLVRERQPVLLLDTPAAKWSALQRWSDSYLRQHMDADAPIPGVIVSKQREIVYYDPKRPATTIAGMEAARLPQHEKRPMSVAEFFAAVNDTTDEQYVYWVAKKHAKNLPEFMVKDLQPMESMTVTSSSPKLQVWVGEHGLTSVFHYDASHNMYVQLVGEKAFALLPASAAPRLGICPFFHPGDGHSCMDWRNGDLKRALRSLRPQLVVLKPGDVLYIPPYTLHHVVTTGAGVTMSASLITESTEQQLMLQVEKMALELEEVPQRQRPAVVAWLILDVLERLKPLDKTAAVPAKTVQRLLDARYTPWLKHAGDTHNSPLVPKCAELAAEAAKPLAASSAKVAAVFEQVEDRGVRDILLYNYFEAMSAWATVDPLLVPVFLQRLTYCWRLSSIDTPQ